MEKEIEILVLDDNEQDRELIQDALLKHNLHPHFIYSQSKDLISMLGGDPYVLIMDFYLIGENLIDDQIIKRVKELCEDCYMIIISGQNSERNFIELLNANADHYVKKTGNTDWLERLVNAIENGRKIVKKRVDINTEQKEIERDLEEVRRKLNVRLGKYHE